MASLYSFFIFLSLSRILCLWSYIMQVRIKADSNFFSIHQHHQVSRPKPLLHQLPWPNSEEISLSEGTRNILLLIGFLFQVVYNAIVPLSFW